MKFWFAVLVGMACSALWLGPVDALDAARGPGASSIFSADVLATPPSVRGSANESLDRPARGAVGADTASAGANSTSWAGPGHQMSAVQAIIVTVPPGSETVGQSPNPGPGPDEGAAASNGDRLAGSNAERRFQPGLLPITGSSAFTLRMALVAVGLIEVGLVIMVGARRLRSDRSDDRASSPMMQ